MNQSVFYVEAYSTGHQPELVVILHQKVRSIFKKWEIYFLFLIHFLVHDLFQSKIIAWNCCSLIIHDRDLRKTDRSVMEPELKG